MKKETGKGKKWLLPTIIAAVLLVIGGAVAAWLLLPDQNRGQQAEAAAAAGQIYWNLDREANLDPDTGLSIREPNEQGQYIVRFLKDGQVLELQVVDKQLVNYLDQMPAAGLIFDGDGVVVDAVEAKNVANELVKNFFVMKHSGNVLAVNSSVVANGVSLQLNVENAIICDVSANAADPGAQATCNVLDEVVVYGREDGSASHVFIVSRSVEADVYLRIKQCYDSKTASTTREPDADGVYTVEFAHKGQLVSLKCRDQKLVTAIDKVSAPQNIMGLLFDEEGYIEKTVTAALAIRGKLLADNYTITEIDGDVLSMEKLLYNAKDLGRQATATLAEDCEIYFAEDECVAQHLGQKADGLQVGDRVFCFTDMDNRAKLIFISRRMQDYEIYYNVSQKYDSETGETTREKENGWYVFEMIGEGKTRELRTKDKKLASFIDSLSSKTLGIKRSGSTIEAACHMNCLVGNRQPGEGRFVAETMSNIIRIVSASNFTSGGNYMLSGEAQIIDVTGDYGINPGSQVKELRQGDRLSFWIDVDGNLGGASVTQRYYAGSKLYYNYTRTYSAERKQTKRLPDAEGYYVFPMICEGKEVTVKTKSLEMASFIDKDSSRFVALKVGNDGVVKNAYKHVSAIQYGRRTLNSVYYNGMNADGTVKYYYFSDGKRIDGSSSQTIAKNCKIYNYSEIYTNNRGEKTKLQKGDQIQGFARYDSKELVYIFVKAREFDSKLYYPVSQQYNSTTMETKRQPAEDGYYYVELAVEGEIKTFKTKDKDIMSQVDSYANGFGMQVNENLIQLVFPAASIRGISGSSGGYYDVMKLSGSKMSLTRNRPASAGTGNTVEIELAKNYKVYDVSKTATQFGEKATLGLGDRVVSYLNDDGKATVIFIVNKHTRQEGYVGYCDHCGKEVFWEHFGGTVYAADAHYYLPYTNENGYSQKTIGYTAGQLAADETLRQYEIVFDLNGQTYYASSGMAKINSRLTILDSVGTGKVVAGGSGLSGGEISLVGKVSGMLNISGGAKLEVSKLDTASRIEIAADGIFTKESQQIANWLDCFLPAVAGMTVKQEGNALSCTLGEVSFTENLTFTGDKAICPVCKAVAVWTPITQETYGETAVGIIAAGGSHYYLAEDITYTGAETFINAPGNGKTACLHLNGHDLTATRARALGGYPGVFNIMGTGVVSGNYQNESYPEYASTIHINTNKPEGAINLYSGTYTQAEGNPQLTVAGSPVNGGQINVFQDATIVAKSSPYVYYGGKSSATDSRFTLQGATVEGGIYMINRNTDKTFATYLEITNGTVTGDIIVGKDGNVTLSGNVTLGGMLDLTSGTKLTLTDLEMVTPVAVKANGIFTEATEQAGTYQTFFVPAAGYEAITVKDNALYTQEKAPSGYTDDLVFTSGTTAYCAVCQKNVKWTVITQEQYSETGVGTPADGAHYYLAEDIVAATSGSFISGPIRSGQVPHVACFHLNGHNLTNTAGNAIGGNSGILNVLGSGTVTGSLNMSDKTRGSTVNINTTAPQGTVNLYSGTYAKAEGNGQKSVIAAHNNGGKINIYEDVTVLCGAGENAVYLGNSKNNHTYVTVYGGTLGGSIRAAARYGEMETHLSILGGNIAADVIVADISSFTLGGAPVIGGMVDLTSGMKLTLGDLQETAIRVKADGAFTLANEKASLYAAYFLPTDGYLPVAVKDNVLYLNPIADVDNSPLVFAEGTTEAACPVCGQTVTWTAITGEENAVEMKTGHYFLPEDVTVNGADNGQNAYLYQTGGQKETVCFHLNGHALTVSGNRAVAVASGTLNVMGGGKLSGETDTTTGSAVYVGGTGTGATVNLLGGTYTKSEADTAGSILCIGENGGSINIYKEAVVDATDRTTATGGTAVLLIGSEGKPAAAALCGGTIKNGHADEKGGNVQIDSRYASFRMESGVITGGSSGTNGGNIYTAANGVLEILGGTVQNGNAAKYGGNLFSSGAETIRVENAVISGGTATSHAGNIFVEGDLQIVGSTVTGGKSGGNGGNIYLSRRSGNTELAKLTITDSLIGITTLGTDEAFGKGAMANSGGNLYANYADATVTGSRLLGGETTSHGANAIISNGKLTLNNTELSGGTTTAQGGALRVYKSTVVMNGGSISGGSAKKYNEYSNANISLSTESAFYFLGGTITATPEADRRGTGIDVGSGCKLYLGGNATVADTSSLAGINARENSVIRVCDGWSGSANIYLGKLYTAAQEIPAAVLQVVTLDKNLSETAGGAFTGTLTQQGGLKLTADENGAFTAKA